MLQWLKSHLQTDAGLSSADAATLWAAISLAFFFLLWASEYLVNDHSWSTDRVVHGEDLEAMSGGQRVTSFQGADEIVLHITGSKTDQYNVGTVRNHYRAESALCPVAALAA